MSRVTDSTSAEAELQEAIDAWDAEPVCPYDGFIPEMIRRDLEGNYYVSGPEADKERAWCEEHGKKLFRGLLTPNDPEYDQCVHDFLFDQTPLGKKLEAQRQHFAEVNCRRREEAEAAKKAKFPLSSDKPSIKLICSRCLQMNKQALSHGKDASEPLWRATLSIAKFSSPNACIELSDGYSGFDEREMQSKLNNISLPFRCSTFEEDNHGGCNGCRYKGHIKTPISLGYENEPNIRGKK